MEEKKPLGAVDKKIDDLLNVADVLYKFKGWIEPQDYFTVQDSQISLWPDDEGNSRRYVGALIRIFKTKPAIEKGPAQLTAVFRYNGVTIRVINYKTKKCVKVVKKIVHEAQPEKVIPAVAGWIEEIEELVCEMPGVEAEVSAAAPASAEVPF